MNSNIQEKYMEYQMLVQQFQQLQENISSLDKHIIELRRLDDNLTSISKSKINEETLMPLGSGIFLKGELKNNSHVVMNVGNNILVEKTIDEAKETVNKQVEEVRTVLQELNFEFEKISERLNHLQTELQNVNPEELE